MEIGFLLSLCLSVSLCSVSVVCVCVCVCVFVFNNCSHFGCEREASFLALHQKPKEEVFMCFYAQWEFKKEKKERGVYQVYVSIQIDRDPKNRRSKSATRELDDVLPHTRTLADSRERLTTPSSFGISHPLLCLHVCICVKRRQTKAMFVSSFGLHQANSTRSLSQCM